MPSPPSPKNKLIIAAAGSGKTTLLVDQALRIKGSNVLITTYTEANEAEIRDRIVEKHGFIPSNVKVQTWFAFLLQHGVRPFQNCVFEKDIKGLNLIVGVSAPGSRESAVEKHYFDADNKIYSDKVSKSLLKCGNATNGLVLQRMAKIYQYIFIDEVQDLAGYDLDFLRRLFASSISTLLVGDPRQGTYSTNQSSKNRKFQKTKILNFFEDDSLGIEKDENLLTTNHRSNQMICDFAGRLFPGMSPSRSSNHMKTGHDGVFLVRPQDISAYLKKVKPAQLRYNKNIEVNKDYIVMNFGESKGQSFDHVLIYPTGPIKKWLKDNQSDLKPDSRSKLYVAITRARYSVAFVDDFNSDEMPGILNYSPAEI